MPKKLSSSDLSLSSDRDESPDPPFGIPDSLLHSRHGYERLATAENDEDPGKIVNNPFSNPEVAKRYRLIYEKAQYECRHYFDPVLSWTAEEEQRVLASIDRRICLWACIMFLALQMDRGNLTQALSDNILDDLNMNTNNYNVGNTIFLIAFTCAELPSQLLSKKVGPDVYVPTLIALWSIVAISQAGLRGVKSFYATRALLGLLEGGFVSDVILWLSYFYTSRELPIRLSFFWTSISVTSILTSILGFGLLHMRGIGGWAAWQWLFLLEGILTLIIGLASYFMMPASAMQTKKWYRPNGWFTEHELGIVVNRVLRDDPSKGDMNNRQGITFRRLWSSLIDYDLWPLYIIGFVADIPANPVGVYISLTLRSLGFSTITTSLLLIPSSALHIISLLGITSLSERYDERTLFAMAQSVWTLPCLIALRFWPGAMTDMWGTYALVVVTLSYPAARAIVLGWLSKNSNTVGARTVSVTLYNICVEVGYAYSNNIYKEDDKPLYRRGNTTLLIINALAIGVFVLTKLYYVARNRRRDRVWASMDEQQRHDYIHNSKDIGSKRLDFRFAH